MKLDNRTIRLIAVGAAVGANCQACLQANYAKALEAGALPQEIAEAVEIGKMVRACAASKVDDTASSLGNREHSSLSGTNGNCGCEASVEANSGGKND